MKNIDNQELLQAARQVAINAYAPYSKFRVGAAVLSKSGKIYVGTNVENASYSLSICAERVALAKAIADGEKDLIKIAIACIDSQEELLSTRMPCGACRQWIQELAPNAEILILDSSKTFYISDLLPIAFDLA